jgi:methenyltetrahydrofolate cyclohydrolase
MSMQDDAPPPETGRYPPAPDGRPQYLGVPLGQFLELISAPAPAPGGGAAAALAVALGASLCAMAARLSPARLAPAEELGRQAERLRDSAARLSEADAEAYGRVIEALRLPGRQAPAAPERDAGHREPAGAGQDHDRQQAVARALSAAADVPLAVAEIAAQVARLAARLAEHGNPNLRGDAVTAALLAEAGARAAGALVEINLASAPDDPRIARATALLRDASESARRASRTAAR